VNFIFQDSLFVDTILLSSANAILAQNLCKIWRSDFNNNSVTDGPTVEIVNSTFSDNVGNGKLYKGLINGIVGPHLIQKSVFFNNLASFGVSVISLSGMFLITGVSFDLNRVISKSKTDYGCLSIEPFGGNFSKIEHSFFRNNIGMNGSSLIVQNGYLFIVNTSFIADKVSYGSIYILGNAIVKVSLSLFQNSSSVMGSGIYLEGFSNLEISDSFFISNTAALRGGALFASENSNLAIFRVTFYGNKAENSGAISLDDKSSIFSQSSSFIRNTATGSVSSCFGSTGSGGGIFFQSSNCGSTFVQNRFEFNTASLFGGALGFETVQECADTLLASFGNDANFSFFSNNAHYGKNFGSRISQQDATPLNYRNMSGFLNTIYQPEIIFRDGFKQAVEGLSNCKLRFKFSLLSSSLMIYSAPYPKLYANGALLSVSLSNPTVVSLPFVLPKLKLSNSSLNPKDIFNFSIQFESSGWLLDKQSCTNFNITVRLCDNGERLFQTASGNVMCQKCHEGSIPNITLCSSCPEGKSSDIEQCVSCFYGRFSPIIGSSICSPCIPGRYSHDLGSSTCALCPYGFFSELEQSSSCLTCFEGSTTRFEGSSNRSACICPQGYYGYQNCLKCRDDVKGISCPAGSTFPVIEEGFFRIPGEDPNVIRQCVIPSACPYTGSDTFTNCKEGYTGMGCGTCLQGYFWSDSGCKTCDGSGGLLASLVIFLFIILFIAYRIASSQNLQSSPADIKVAIAGIQMVAALAKSSKKWPPFMSSFMSGLSVLNFDINVTSPACTFGSSFWGFYYVSLILPFLFCCIVSLVSWIVSRFSKARSRERLKSEEKKITRSRPKLDFLSKSIAAFIFLMSTMYTFIALNAFRPFQCLEQPDGTFTMLSYPSLNCYDSSWYSNLGLVIIMILITVIAYPVGVGFILFKNRRNIRNPEFFNRFGYLVDPYSDRFFWWELYSLAKKTFFSLILNSVMTLPDIERSFYLTMYLFFCLILESICKPFKNEEINSLNAIWNLISILWLIALAVLFIQQNEQSDQVLFFSYSLIAIFILTAAFCFFRFSARKMLQMIDDKQAEKIHKDFKSPENPTRVSRKSSSGQNSFDTDVSLANYAGNPSRSIAEFEMAQAVRKELDSDRIYVPSTI
jgi:hypothetical protein